jgi:diacylglycerol kinase
MKLIRSIKYALRGLAHMPAAERNFRWLLVAAVAVIVAGLWLRISINEWIALTVAIGGVLVLEMVNTAIERVMNLLHPGMSPQVRTIKDIAAGAVLVAAFTAVAIAILVFYDEVASLF